MWPTGDRPDHGELVDPKVGDSDPFGACVALGDAPGLPPTYTLWLVQEVMQTLEELVPPEIGWKVNECHFGIILPSEKKGGVDGKEVAGGCWGKYNKTKHSDVAAGQTKFTCPFWT